MKTFENFEIQINSLIQARRPNFIEDLPDHWCGCVSGGHEGNKKGKIAGYHLGAEETVEHDSLLCTYNMWNTWNNEKEARSKIKNWETIRDFLTTVYLGLQGLIGLV